MRPTNTLPPSPEISPTERGATADVRDGATGNGRVAAPAAGRSPAGDAAEIATVLGVAGAAHPALGLVRRALRWGIPIIIVLVGTFLFVRSRRAPAGVQYETQSARRGDLTVTVTATGTLAPLDTVYVGTEVSGIVDVVAADYNDHVQKGQILAVVNTDQLQAQIRQGEAALEAARAAAQQAAATLVETEPQAARAESLFAQRMISQQDVESARAALARARAAEASARAQVSGARAALQAQQTVLRKATIRAPISGIVLQRQVERGRTVTAAFQTPVLFVLAADLARMTLALDVDEADIGQVAVGQDAEFTVDAYPERTFSAKVRSVRNAAQTVEGVVTYQAILDVANTGLLLRPGMTATARIGTALVRDALLVPNAALRFTPPNQPTPSEATGVRPAAPAHQVWTLRAGSPLAIPVTVGLSDGQWTEVMGGTIPPGTPLLVNVRESGSTATTAASASQASPPRPGLFGGRRAR